MANIVMAYIVDLYSYGLYGYGPSTRRSRTQPHGTYHFRHYPQETSSRTGGITKMRRRKGANSKDETGVLRRGAGPGTRAVVQGRTFRAELNGHWN